MKYMIHSLRKRGHSLKTKEKQSKLNSGTLKKIFRYIKHYRGLLFLSIIFAAVTVVLTLYIPILVGRAIDFIVGKEDVNFDAVLKILLQIGIIASVTALLQWVMNIINNKITFHVIRDIRDEAFKKIQILPLKYLDKHAYGEIVSRVISDVDQFAEGLLMGFTQLFTGVVTILGTFFFMLSINWMITAVVVIFTPMS